MEKVCPNCGSYHVRVSRYVNKFIASKKPGSTTYMCDNCKSTQPPIDLDQYVQGQSIPLDIQEDMVASICSIKPTDEIKLDS